MLPKIVKATALVSFATVTTVGVLSAPPSTPGPDQDRKVVVIGGGTAGIGVAAMLQKSGMKNVTVVEPSQNHYYQPLWTLVGAGIKDNKESVRPMSSVIPSGVNWVQSEVRTFQPDENKVTLADGTAVKYDYLIVAPGMQIDWNKIPGLVEGLEKPDSGVVSIYDYKYSQKTWTSFLTVAPTAKRMLFTMPPTLIKCAGAPQKIMWLLEDILTERKLRDKVSVEFWVPGGAMFGIKRYADMLDVLRKERNVSANFKQELVSINVEKKVATFKNLDTKTTSEQEYDLLHVTPPMSAPDVIKTSPLADANGWMDVDKNTLRSTKYSNVFGLGDCTNTPNSKTAAAVISQSSVLVHNLQAAMKGAVLDGYYRGYASCPLIIKRGRVILAEFGYGGKIMESFSPETGKFPLTLLPQGDIAQRFFYFLKEDVFPRAYWTFWVRGLWHGSNGPIWPNVTVRDDEPQKK